MIVILAGCGGGSSSSNTASTTPSGGQASGTRLQSRFESAVRTASPRVVQIRTGSGLGSGIVFDNQGDIVTNAHVVRSAKRIQVTLGGGQTDSATVRGSFAPDDIAVVRLANRRPKPATFDRSSQLQVGDIVMAVGNPLGLRSSVTEGIVSAVGRTVSEPNGATLPNVIQTSAPINPGNSGGALVDLAGHVVGIPTLAATDPELGGSAAPGIGFAIPSDTVRDIAGQIVAHGHVVNSHRAYLGVELASGPVGAPGAVVAAVQSGGPADRAGLHRGDVIVSIAGHRVASAQAVSTVLAGRRPGDTVKVKLAGGRTVSVKLGTFPGG